MNNFLRIWKEQLKAIIENNSLSLRQQRITLIVILSICFAVRILTIDAPALDRTSWKEIDYMAISQNYVENGFDFLKPEITWPAEPPRVTAMELPIVPYLAGIIYVIAGYNVYTVRLIPLISWIIVALYVYRITRREVNPILGLLAAAAAAAFPLYHEFGRILFSEPLMIAFSVMSVFYLAEMVEFGSRKSWLLATITFSLALSLKPTSLYMMLPLSWIAFRAYRFQIKQYYGFLLMVVCAMIIPIAWFSYAYYITEKYIDVFGIFGGHNKMQTITMLSNPQWYITMLRRIGGGILGGPLGTFIGGLGFFSLIIIGRGKLFLVYFAAILSFFVIVAEGQIDAPYRQLTSVPPLSVFFAMGSISIIICLKTLCKYIKVDNSTSFKFRESRANTFYCFSFILLIVFFQSGKIFVDSSLPSDKQRWEISGIIKNLVPNSSKLVVAGEYTIHKGGNDLSPVIYHYTNLQGWTIQKDLWDVKKIQDLIDRGATHFVAISMKREPESLPFIKEMIKKYKILYSDQDNDLIILNLNKLN